MGNAGWLPRKARETTAAITAATTTGGNAATASEPSTSSSAKKAPASGALKLALIPAAAPAPTSTFTRSGPKRKARPRNEPTVDPSTATGPSLPALPPAPSVTAAASVRTAAGRVGISPLRRATASCTAATLSPP